MKDYFTLGYRVSFFRRIINFLSPKKRRFLNELRKYIKSVDFQEKNPLPNISFRKEINKHFNSENPDYIGF